MHKRPGDRNALLLAARELVGQLGGMRGQTHSLERLRDSASPLAWLDAIEQQGDLDILRGRGLREQCEALRDEAAAAPEEARSFCAAQHAPLYTGHTNRSPIRLVKPAKHVEERAFA
jgi:hypothetical protein